MYLILGHPRCGTGYMAALFRRFGLDVGHEKLGKHGISCWSWATFDPAPPWAPGPRPALYGARICHVVHVVRNPWKAIPSIAYTDREARSFRSKYAIQIPSWPELDNAALSFVAWNHLIAAQGPDEIVQVERAPEQVAEWLGLPVPADLPPQNVNTRRHLPMEPGMLRPETRELVERFCEEYSYTADGPVGMDGPEDAERTP